MFLLLFSVTTVGTVALLTDWRLESKQAAAKRDFTELLASGNFAHIRDIENTSKPLEEPEDERWKTHRELLEESRILQEISQEIIRQFPSSVQQRRCEEVVFLVFLDGALEKNTSFAGSKRQFSERLKENVSNLAARILPENRRNGKGSLTLAETANSSDPAAIRWLMIPSLRNFLKTVKNTPEAERFFPVFLFSETSAGIGMKEARKAWEKIRTIESSNTGRDSLGMFPATLF
jgi:hypothetical protein